MKFTCEKNQLVSAISVASRTVAQKSAISGLEGILVRAGVKVMLTGYNLETGITVSVDADVQENGACIMPARLFFDIVRKLPDDTVSIQVDENFKVSIKGGISSFTITALSADDYPELPDVDSEKGIRGPQCELKAMISGTIFAVSENQAQSSPSAKIRHARFIPAFSLRSTMIPSRALPSTATVWRCAGICRRKPWSARSNSSRPQRH